MSDRPSVIVAAGSSPAPFWGDEAHRPSPGVPLVVHFAQLVAAWGVAERVGMRLQGRAIVIDSKGPPPSIALGMAFREQRHGLGISAAIASLFVQVDDEGRIYPHVDGRAS